MAKRNYRNPDRRIVPPEAASALWLPVTTVADALREAGQGDRRLGLHIARKWYKHPEKAPEPLRTIIADRKDEMHLNRVCGEVAALLRTPPRGPLPANWAERFPDHADLLGDIVQEALGQLGSPPDWSRLDKRQLTALRLAGMQVPGRKTKAAA